MAGKMGAQVIRVFPEYRLAPSSVVPASIQSTGQMQLAQRVIAGNRIHRVIRYRRLNGLKCRVGMARHSGIHQN